MVLLILYLISLLLTSYLKSLLLALSLELLLLNGRLLSLSLSLTCCQLYFLLLANNLQLFYFLIFCLFLFQSQSFHLTLICFFLQSSCSCLDIYSHLRLIILLILLLNLLLLLCILNRLFCNFCRSRLVLKRVSIKALAFLQTLCFLLCLCRTCTFNIWFSLRL